jgi:hypothetical protein
MTDTERNLARALVEAHTAPEVRSVVLDAFDSWAAKVQEAQEAIEQQARSEDDLNRFYTIPELRLLLRKSDSGVRALLDDGTLPFTRIGEGRNSIRVPIAPVERYLTEQTIQNAATPAKPRPAAPRLTPDEQAVVRRWPGLVD